MDKNSKTQMMRFRQEAEEAFSSFSGEEDDNFADEDENYADDEDNYADEDENYVDEDYYTGGTGLDKLDPNDRTLSFKIINATDGTLVAELFGAFKNGISPNFGNPIGLTVTLGESSYPQFLQETISSPVLIKGLRYFVKNEIQLSNSLEIVEETATGATTSKKYQPGTRIDPRSFKNNILIDPSFTMPITGRHILRVPVNAREECTLILTISTRVDQGKTLQGRPVLEVTKKKRKRPLLGKRRG